MADQIEADYEALKQVHQKLGQLAGDVEQLGKDIGSRTITLHDEGWQGQGSDAFYQEMEEDVAPGIRRLRQALERANGVVEKVAQIIHEAEEEARSSYDTATR